MRLSDAIALGRTLVNPMRGFLLDDAKKNGCALGMGLMGCGSEKRNVAEEWPWTANWADSFPCGCARTDSMGKVIAHIFDEHVCDKPQSWTLDQLIDWVRSVEPAEIEISDVATVKTEALIEEKV